MNRLQALLLTAFIIFGSINSGYCLTEVRGDVEGVWDLDGSPYVAIDRIVVGNRNTLIIEPGVEVLFRGTFPFIIYGLLNAEGEEGDSILFGPHSREAWQGLHFSSCNENTVLDYCIITGGYAMQGGGGLDSLSCGGNLFIWSSDIAVSHSRISRGQARGFGGGVTVWHSEPTFEECLINENFSHQTAGGFGYAYQSAGTILNCRFSDNSANSSAGGLYCYGQSSPTIEGCLFDYNEVNQNGGALYIANGSSPHIHHCRFYRNSAEAGGAAYIRSEGTSPLIEWCEFNQNAANAGNRIGGAFYIRERASPEIRYNLLSQNNANRGGALYTKEQPRCNIHHNLFLKNAATGEDVSGGGGAFATSDDLGDTPITFTNCTFIGNRDIGINPRAHTGNFRGDARAVITSSILWTGEPRFSGEGSAQIVHTNVLGGAEGEGNSDENPAFFGTDSTWFILSGNSPCIDSGDPDLPEDPDETRNDRGWLHYPQNASLGLETDTLETALWDYQREYVTLRYRNDTGVPIYLTPMDRWQAGEPMIMANVTARTHDNEIFGAAWTDGGFFISGANSGDSPNMMYQLDRDLALVTAFEQPGRPGGSGFWDLATDGGDLLFGSNQNYIYEFTTDGEFGDRYVGPDAIHEYRALGADTHNPYGSLDFYIGGAEGIIIRTDSEMWERARLTVGEVIYSLSVKWNTRALYIVTRTEANEYLLSLVIPDDELIIPLYNLEPPEGDFIIGGIEVTQDWETGHGSLVGIWRTDDEADDVMFVLDLYTVWLNIRPELKLLMPGETAEWEIEFIGNQLPPGLYTSHFSLPVNGSGEGMEVQARIETMSGIAERPATTPLTCMLGRIYPNPFNGRAAFTYSLSQPQPFMLSIVDLTGRRVMLIADGIGQAGEHRACIDACGIPSGAYYLKLATPSGSEAAPLMILK